MELSGARILVVDDHADLAENLRELLEDEGAQVALAATAAAGLALAQAPFDVALVDVGLPDAVGVSLLPALKGAGDGNAEVLVITGNASVETAIGALAGGAYAYVLKPFDPEALVHLVGRALRQVRSTREAEALRETLAQREESLSTLVDTVQALLLVLDGEGRVLQANHAVARAVGLAPEALVGVDWIDRFIPEADRAASRAALAGIVAGEVPVSRETRLLGADAEGRPVARWVSWRTSAVRDPAGAVRIYASGLDTTEVRELERRARLSEKLAAVGTLSAGLAHEIRNPLNAASLQLRLLERRVGKREDAGTLTEPIDLVREELGRLSNLVVEFLAFARPSELKPETVDVVSLARKVVDLKRPGAEERRIALAAELPETQVEILGDADKLQQVLLNLVRNATEAVGEGGRVSVRVDVGAEGVVLAVVDDGPGIPVEHQSRIFEPFYSTKPGGTGLGMAIVHSLVSLHGGQVSVRSEAGTEVRVLLPRHGPPGEALAGPA